MFYRLRKSAKVHRANLGYDVVDMEDKSMKIDPLNTLSNHVS